MSEQQAPAQRDTPAVAGPTEAPGTQEQAEVDWQKRYTDLQPEYTRTSQEAAQLRDALQHYEQAITSDDPDTRRQALEALGYELPEEEEPEPAEYEDPYEELRAEVTSVRERQEQAEQAARQQAEFDLMNGLTQERLNAIEGLSDGARDWVLAYAINALPPIREQGVSVPLPDLQQAYETWQALQTEEQKSWAKTKRAPYVSPGGQSANEVPDRSTHEGRVAFGLERLRQFEDET